MLDPTVLPEFLIATLLITVTPGPDNAFVAAVAVSRGARAGALSAAGMASGMLIHMTAAALGLAVLLRSTPGVLDCVRLAGGGYLAWLATTAIVSARRSGLAARTPPAGRLFGQALLTNLTNPKVILFFAAFMPQFVRTGHGSTAAQLLTLGAIFLAIGFVSDTAIGLAAGRLGDSLAPGAPAAYILNLAAGATFGVLAALLVIEVIRS